MIQDGALSYGYDRNGNRTAVNYPGDVDAAYTFHFADREATLAVTSPAGTAPVVSASAYLPAGPLAALSLGNGTTETRGFTPRYFPDAIALDAARDRGYTFTTDSVGNVRSITEAVECFGDVVLENRSVTGSEIHQSCAQVLAGPALTVEPAASLTLRGATAVVLRKWLLRRLRRHLFRLAVGGERTFAHGPAGHLTTVSSSGNVVDFDTDAAGRLSRAERFETSTPFAYDGRSYLVEAGAEVDAIGATRPVYSSDGLLHALRQRITASDPGEIHLVFHFAGRPVAQLSIDADVETWRYLTTDHLGTPLIATDATGTELWHGPFEPFGRDRWAVTNLAASAQDVFLRYPGQWDDDAWMEATRGAEVYYNVHRWYQSATGRYTRPDPLGAQGDPHPYLYATANPLLFFDPLGEKSRVCCTPVPVAPGPAKHCFIEYEDHRTGESTTYGLHRVKGKGCKYRNDGFDQTRHPERDPRTPCGPLLEVCGDNICLDRAFDAYPNPSDYQLIRGPNSNSFARTLSDACGLTPPSIAGEPNQTPGWHKEGRPAKNRNFTCPPQR